MSDSSERLIRIETVRKLLLGQEEYITEFATASIQSFGEFSDAFTEALLQRNMEKLRMAGHRIRPVATMLEVEQIVEEYELAKELLENDADEENLGKSADAVKAVCDRIISEFREIRRRAGEEGES